jgi:hypothetical protein
MFISSVPAWALGFLVVPDPSSGKNVVGRVHVAAAVERVGAFQLEVLAQQKRYARQDGYRQSNPQESRSAE